MTNITTLLGLANGGATLTEGAIKVLDNPNGTSTGSASDNFGYSVAISGDYAIVGAYQEDDAGDNQSGKAYIFDTATGNLLRTLRNPNAHGDSAGDWFGSSVAISANYAVVGAPGDDEPYRSNAGRAYIFNTATGVLHKTLTNPNAYSDSANDNFGNAVAVDGNYAIVGAYLEGDANGGGSGKAYIFDVTTGLLHKTLDNPNGYGAASSDQFGYSVAISGNYAIVGTPYEDDVGGGGSGKAYIFDVTTGALHKTLSNPNGYGPSANDYFGWSVAISGNYAIVGAYQEDGVGGSDSGKAYIFDVTTGLLHKTLDNPNGYGSSANDYFGISVAISGNYAIVGAYLEGDAKGTSSGKAYVFNVTTGELHKTLDNPSAYGTSTGDQFGWSVAISGNYAIVGAYQEDDVGGTGGGKAYLLKSTDGSLVRVLDNPNAYGASLYDRFGNSVAIDGNYAIVGAYFGDDANGGDSGKAHIFDVATGSRRRTLSNPNAYGTGTGDEFGYSVAISGNYAIVGAPKEDEANNEYSGNAYIFDVGTGALLRTLSNPNAYGTSYYDWFGSTVAISGNYAIVGAYQEDDAGGSDSGKAYIFNVTTGALHKTLSNPNAYGGSANDYFGYSVAISGNYAIVGAYQEDDASGADSGKAYIFDVTTGALLLTLSNPNAYGDGAADYFGRSVAISGNYAIVGAYGDNEPNNHDSGRAYVFNVTTGALHKTLNNPNVYGQAQYDWFGYSVAISGNYAIVSAAGEGSSGGGNSGTVHIFNTTTGALIRTVVNPNYYGTTTNDYFGWSVAISGGHAIVGAYQEDDAVGLDSGKAYLIPL